MRALDLFYPYQRRSLADRFFTSDLDWFFDNRTPVQWEQGPQVHREEDEKGYYLSLDVPGVRKEDLKVELTDKSLVISAESRSENKEEDRVTRVRGSFRKEFTLGKDIPVDGIKAKHEDGVLQLFIPKPEKAEPRLIPVSGSGSAGRILDKITGKKKEDKS